MLKSCKCLFYIYWQEDVETAVSGSGNILPDLAHHRDYENNN